MPSSVADEPTLRTRLHGSWPYCGQVSAMVASVPVMSRSSAKSSPCLRCVDCGWETPKWVGRCAECHSWGSVTEKHASGPSPGAAIPIGQVPTDACVYRSSGLPELDRVLGGGLVPGAVLLLAGEPGVGKSTLLLEVAAQTARRRQRVLYLTGEESAAQVRLRADRTGAIHEELFIAAETELDTMLAHIDQVRPELLVIDSIQTTRPAGADGAVGGVAQVKEVASALIRVAKLRTITTVLIGHVTKDGQVAGPRSLEHLVDVALTFEGDRHSRLRMIRAIKNRYGPADEVGCFELTASGITAVSDPSELFVESHRRRAPGSCVAITMEGRRPLLTEIQALVTPTAAERPRRVTVGLDPARLSLVIAVLQQHCGLRLHGYDVFASTVGGARVSDPAADLATAVAIASAHLRSATPPGVAAAGEVGLAGEIRRVHDVPTRAAEANRLGFSTLLVPHDSCPDAAFGDRSDGGSGVHWVNHLTETLGILQAWSVPAERPGRQHALDLVT
jgi:DNA repair protein RadA/Sms